MSKIEFNPNTPLYTSDEVAWTIEQTGEVLSKLAEARKPIIIFVHGRGKEPNKSLRGATFVVGQAVRKLEEGYGARVLMFNWDSAFPGFNFRDRTRALENAGVAGPQFGLFLDQLSDFRRTNPEFPAPVLLAHSMGCFVIKRAVESQAWPPRPNLFRRVLLTQPDADDVGHQAWLERLASTESVISTFNRDDKVLRKSNDDRPQGSHALGLGTAEILALSAKYVDLTNMGAIGSYEDDDHEVFGKGAMNGQVYVREFFEQALRGEEVLLDTAVNVEAIERQVVYRLKAKFGPGSN